MIKFFRNIRQKLIEQENIRKYLLYAIGEIFLVVIGILIALQVNNWNEQRKQNNRENELLTQLKGDINLLLDELDEDITYLQDRVAVTDTLIFFDEIGKGKNWAIYSKNHFSGNPMVFPTRATFDNLKSIGVELISDLELRNRITDLYDRKLIRSSTWEDEVYKYQDRVEIILEESFKYIKSDTTSETPIFMPDTFIEFAANRKLINTIISFQSRRRYLIERYRDTQVLSEEIIKELGNY